jgi:heptaprenylglyceryl phosphate synthase
MEREVTDVTMCQGSKKTREMNIQRTYVDSRDTMSVKNISFVNSLPNVNFPSWASASTDLMVMNTEAKRRYLEVIRTRFARRG